MFGQGSPVSVSRSTRAGPPRSMLLKPGWLSALCWCALSICGDSVFAQALPTQAPSNNLRTHLRVFWGGPNAESWSGTLQLDQGNLSGPSPLGFNSAAAGAISEKQGAIEIRRTAATTYAGLDFWADYQPGAVLKIRLTSDNHSPFELDVPFDQLTAGSITRSLGSDGNQLTLTRVPGDKLQVELDRDDLVFDSSEQFNINIQPVLTELGTRTANLRLKIVPARQESPNLWSRSTQISIDKSGTGEPTPFEIPLPLEEGVYDLNIELEPIWYQAPFSMSKPVQRRVQFVVLAEHPPTPTPEAAWKTHRVYQAANLSGNRNSGWPSLNLRRAPRGIVLGNERRHQITLANESFLELQPGGWQSIPIEFEASGRPQMIEIDYHADKPVALGISILEIDAVGQVPMMGVDTGVLVPDSIVSESADSETVKTHRFVIWPQQTSAYLLLANRHDANSVVCGEIRILTGPERLSNSNVKYDPDLRRMMAQIKTPFFSELFGGTKSIDPEINQPLDDWVTFYVAADRLIQHLRANGYRGAFMNVASDGSALFPNAHLQPTPKFDSGTFFSKGQDPVRKDVLKLLLRMFEREGLVLVPTLTFATPLPNIEATRIERPASQIELVDFRNNQNRQSQLPAYNPLSILVQNEVTDIVRELSTRYADSSAFGGIGISCPPESFAMLPGREWGYDRTSVDQFVAASGIDISKYETRQMLHNELLGRMFDPWMAWRTKRLTDWYRQLGADTQRARGDAELFLIPENVYRNDEIASALSPNLHLTGNFAAALNRLGLQPQSALEGSNVRLISPHRIDAIVPLGKSRIERFLDDSPQTNQFYKSANQSVEMFTHYSTWAHFAELQQMTFPNQESPLMRLQPLTPSGKWNCERFAKKLKTNDSSQMIDGGLSLLRGQDSATQEFVQTYNSLPRQSFGDVKCTQANPRISPVAFRQLRLPSGWFGYAVNASPWRIKITIDFIGNSTAIRRLGDAPTIWTSESGSSKSVTLEPFELIGFFSEETDLVANKYTFEIPELAERELRYELQRLQSNLIKSNNAEPVPLLENADFENTTAATLTGWTKGEQPSTNAKLDLEQGQSGAACFQLYSDGSPAWIRSNEFRTPETGRLSVSVWLKTDNADVQPPIRIAVEGRTGNRNYYRFGEVGGAPENGSARRISTRWQRFAVHFDDLPVEGMENLRIGFDLMGPGTIWIDSVRVYDRWFDENDTKAMTQILAGAAKMLSNRDTLNGCRLILESYWPQFLREHFGEENNTEPIELEDLQGDRGPMLRTSSGVRRLRSLVPKKPLPIR